MSKRPNAIGDLAQGAAALAICESLLLALTEKGVIGAIEANGILEDAAAKRATPKDQSDADIELAAAAIIEDMRFDRSAFRCSTDLS